MSQTDDAAVMHSHWHASEKKLDGDKRKHSGFDW